MKKSTVGILAAILALVTSAGAQTAVWINASGGLWSNTANWLGGNPPGPGTNVDINANGTYTSTAQGSSTCANLAVGTASTTGTQNLAIDGTQTSPLTFSNLVVGSRGVFSYGNNSFMYGTGLVTVAAGGQLVRSSGAAQGGFYSHDIAVQGGGRWTIAAGATHSVPSDVGRAVTYTINGALDGGGTVDFNDNNNPVFLTGTGRLDVTQITLNNNNGLLYLGGTLTINSAVIQSNAISSAVVLTNGAVVTLNGPHIMQGASSALLVLTNTDSATVTGTNLISVRHDDGGRYGVFTGCKSGAGGTGGSITIGGSGNLEVYQASTLSLRVNAAVLNLQRNSRFWATTNAAAIRPAGPLVINANGPGTTMTLDTNIALRLWNSTIILNVTNGATLALRNGILEGGNNGGTLCTNVFVGRGSAATLAFRAGSTNLFRRSSEGISSLCVTLGANANVAAEAGSDLQLQDCRLAVAFTNASAWGWKSDGVVEFLTNSFFEAMSSDRGTNVLFSAQPFGVKSMRFSCPVSLTNTLFNGGSTDNDGDGLTDSVVYVETLDLSGMAGGTSATLAGSGITAPKLYYANLINPNNVTLGANIMALEPQNATVGCLFTNSPIPAGAQWRLTSGVDTGWKNSGDAVVVLPGAYTQTFQAIPYFQTPPDILLSLSAGQVTNTRVGYVTNANWGAAQVTLQPAGAVAAGAQWRLTTGPQTNWQASDVAVGGLTPGVYTVTCSTGVPSWFAPADGAITVAGGATTYLTLTYTAMAAYSLTVR